MVQGSDRPPPRSESELANATAARAGFVASRPVGAPNNLFTPKSVSFGGAALITMLVAIRIAPNISYRLHLPIGVFYALLVGGTITAFALRRRWARYLPSDPKPNFDHMDPRAARREAFLMLGRSAFRLVPVLAAIAFVAWFGIFHNTPSKIWVYGIVFAIAWNIVSRSLWDMLIRPRFGRRTT
jgi:hypothetical protein